MIADVIPVGDAFVNRTREEILQRMVPVVSRALEINKQISDAWRNLYWERRSLRSEFVSAECEALEKHHRLLRLKLKHQFLREVFDRDRPSVLKPLSVRSGRGTATRRMERLLRRHRRYPSMERFEIDRRARELYPNLKTGDHPVEVLLKDPRRLVVESLLKHLENDADGPSYSISVSVFVEQFIEELRTALTVPIDETLT